MPIEDVMDNNRSWNSLLLVELKEDKKIQDEVETLELNSTKTIVTGVEMFKKKHLTKLKLETTSGALLRGVQRTDVERGQVLAKPGPYYPHTKFKAQVYVLTKDGEGGRHTVFFNG